MGKHFVLLLRCVIGVTKWDFFAQQKVIIINSSQFHTNWHVMLQTIHMTPPLYNTPPHVLRCSASAANLLHLATKRPWEVPFGCFVRNKNGVHQPCFHTFWPVFRIACTEGWYALAHLDLIWKAAGACLLGVFHTSHNQVAMNYY